MQEPKWTKGNWTVCNMVHAKTGNPMSPEEIGSYVTACVRNGDPSRFLFVSADKLDGPVDICHVGNGPDGPHNARLIAAAQELYEALEHAHTILLDVAKSHGLTYSDAESCADIAAAALAKARGEQQGNNQ